MCKSTHCWESGRHRNPRYIIHEYSFGKPSLAHQVSSYYLVWWVTTKSSVLFAFKKKKCFNSLTWDPNTLQSWKYTATGNSKSGPVFHNSTVLFRSISLYSAPRAFSTTTHTPTCFPCCNTAKSFQCTLASDTWKCIVAVHCECQHLRNSHLFLT